MRRAHRMPFGCQALPEGGVRFRLWAPAVSAVQLVLESAEGSKPSPMVPAGAGWFEIDSTEAHVGARYRFLLDGGIQVPDPASRANPDDAHGPSMVVDPLAFDWQDAGWRGRPWEEAVIYELHVGAFTPAGSFVGVEQRLDYLRELGITAIELMPVADFPGRRNWGYDGVLAFAPDSTYGTPEDLKRLVQAAHERGMMVLLDVVYNHFGPDGNYLHLYAPQFFDAGRHTPWGAAIDFSGSHSRTVRDFYIHNALYWLNEYHLDGLRLDAADMMRDTSRPHILEEISRAVRTGPGSERRVHLVLEDDRNAARRLGHHPGEPGMYDAQWNDDAHHALHVLLTGESDGYYRDYQREPIEHLGRALAEGFAYQGESSAHRGGRARGDLSAHLRPTAFVSFLQNHDQVGNRAYGERIGHLIESAPLRAAVALLLLSPQPPLLFMGEEWGAREPFLFFCDFDGDLAVRVAEGRRAGFARHDRFRDKAARQRIPDPGSEATFDAVRLHWSEQSLPDCQQWLDLYRHLLETRAREIVPRLTDMAGRARYAVAAGELLSVDWTLADGTALHLLANLGSNRHEQVQVPRGRQLYASHPALNMNGVLPPWSVVWALEQRNA